MDSEHFQEQDDRFAYRDDVHDASDGPLPYDSENEEGTAAHGDVLPIDDSALHELLELSLIHI